MKRLLKFIGSLFGIVVVLMVVVWAGGIGRQITRDAIEPLPDGCRHRAGNYDRGFDCGAKFYQDLATKMREEFPRTQNGITMYDIEYFPDTRTIVWFSMIEDGFDLDTSAFDDLDATYCNDMQAFSSQGVSAEWRWKRKDGSLAHIESKSPADCMKR